MSQIKFTPPRVGCSHFFSVVKSVRSESNTLLSGLLDILDNIYGIAKVLKHPGIIADIKVEFNPLYKIVHKITVSDNIPHGFKQILDEGTNNPLNMGHIRDGHNNDIESSEFGTGLKKAIIYTSEKTDIYTRSITDNGDQTYVKVVFDIPNMISRTDPQDSYEPTSFEIIDEEEFNKNSKFEHGSTIVLQNLNDSDFSYDQQTGSRFTEQEFEEKLIVHLSKAYSDLIRDGIFSILLNDKKVPICIDLTDNDVIPLTNKVQYKFYAKLNKKNEPEKIQRVGLTPTGRIQYNKYDPESCKFIKISADENSEFKKSPDVFDLDYVSLSTKQTQYSDKLHYDFTDIVRDGRCYDPPQKYTKQETDGYSNHIYNKICYKSKRLNKVIGVGPNKRVTKPSNMLISAIHMTMKTTTSKWRNFCRNGTFSQINDDSDSDESTITPSKKSKSVSKKMTQVSQQSTTGAPASSNPTTSNPVTAAAPVTSSVAATSNVEKVSQDSSDISSTELQEDLTNPVATNVSLIVTELHKETSIPVTENVSLVVTELEEESSIPDISNVSSLDLEHDSQESILQNMSSTDIISESSEKIKEAAKKLMDLIANGSFNRTDGYKVLKYVEDYINSK